MTIHTCVWINGERCRYCGSICPDAASSTFDKDVLYKEFRRRFLTDLCGRIAVDEGDILMILRRWATKLQMDEISREPIAKFRTCWLCNVADIPYGLDWEWWHDGKPVHRSCLWCHLNPR